LRATISKGAIEYAGVGRAWLRPFTFVAWDLPPPEAGKLYLRATLSPGAATDGKHATWMGKLELPRVALPLPTK